jgi:hypothetical protein
MAICFISFRDEIRAGGRNVRGRPAYSPRTGIIVEFPHLVAKHILSDAANHHDQTNVSSSSSCQQVMNATVTDNRRYDIAAMFAGSKWTTNYGGTATPWSIALRRLASAVDHCQNPFEHHHHAHQAKTTKTMSITLVRGNSLSPGVEPHCNRARHRSRASFYPVPDQPSGEK